MTVRPLCRSKLPWTTVLGTGLLLAASARADSAPYQGIPADQAESITSPDHLFRTLQTGAPSAIWQALEHAEVVDCIDCIGTVAELLYDTNARNREIAAWWLRRRPFGVFGAGEVYAQTVNVLASDPSAVRRADAAQAVGEFLVLPGVTPLATAVAGDSDPGVRAAAATALGRLNDDGKGALEKAFSDTDPTVRGAAFVAAGRLTSFSDVTAAVAVTGDPDPVVRRLGVELLDTIMATDAAQAVLTLAQTDSDSEVRLASCHALGSFGDGSVASALLQISEADASPQVQDQARIAYVRLSR